MYYRGPHERPSLPNESSSLDKALLAYFTYLLNARLLTVQRAYNVETTSIQRLDAESMLNRLRFKKSKRKVQGVPQSQTAALPRPQEEEETDKSKQAQTEQTYEKH